MADRLVHPSPAPHPPRDDSSGARVPDHHRARRLGAHRRLGTALVAALALLVAGVVVAPAAGAADLARNGGFESSLTGWSSSSASTLKRVSGGASGSYAARVTSTAATPSTTVLNDSPNTVSSLTAGKQYRVSAKVRAVQPRTSLVLRAMEYGSSEVSRETVHHWAEDTAWHSLSVTLTAARSGSALDVNVLSWDLAGGRSFDVDDVSVSVVTSGTTTPTTRPAAAEVLPAQGTGALFGYYQSGGADVRPMESKIGRRFDLVHHYEDFDGTKRWPTSTMESLAAGGRTVHVSWALLSFRGSYDKSLQPAPALSTRDPHSGATRRIWTYKQVLNGSMDKYLDTMASGVKASPHTYVVDFNHEMDDLPDVGGSNTLRAAAGSRAEYKAAYRYIVDRFRAKGVQNVVWAWAVSGWYASDSSKAWSLQQLWPGSQYVDLILWDPYNYKRDRWKTFSQLVSPFYGAVRGGVLDKVDPAARSLPLGLGEYGSISDSRRPAWLRSIPTEVKKFPGIVSLGYFSSGSWGALHDDPAAISAFAEAGRSSYLKR